MLFARFVCLTALFLLSVPSSFAGSSAATPRFSVGGGTYQTYKSVTISDSTSGASIYYTVTGVAPTTGSTRYTGPITVNRNMTLRAIAAVSGGEKSPIATATYKFVAAAAPSFSVGGGYYQVHKLVAIADSTPGAAIYYTVTGVTPTTRSTRYTGPIEVNKKMVLKAVAALPDGEASAVTSASYNFDAADAPTFSKGTGTYQGWQTVTISDATPGASIFYTITGATPTAYSTEYTEPITVKGNMTLKAVAEVLGGSTGPVASASYKIVPHSTPIRTPNSAGTFFGLSIDHLTTGTAWPDLPIGTIRLWDSETKWGNLNPKRGTYSWQKLDAQINMARANHADIIYTFGGVPPWALPTKIPIKSIVRSHGIVTVTTSLPHGMYHDPTQPATRQSKLAISGVPDTYFDGSFYVTGTPGVYTLTYAQAGADVSSSGGTMSVECGGEFAPDMCAEAPASLSEWDEYVTELANHVGPGAIHYWELWNEANDPIYWRGDPKRLLAMAEDAHRIIRSVDPSAVFLSPSFTGAYENSDECLGSVEYCGTTWFNNWLALGGKNYIDVVAFHGYPNVGIGAEQIQGSVYQILAAMNRNGVGSLPLWDTESSWATNSNLPEQTDRTAWLAKHLLLEESIGVQRTLWYAYDTPSWGTLWSAIGGVNTAGDAYGEMAKWVTGTTLTQPCAQSSTDTTTFTCGYSRSNGYTAQAVWNTAGSKYFEVSSKFVQYRDIYGVVRPVVGGGVEISTAPILLESSSVF